MKVIKSSNGFDILVDNEDYEYFNQWKWRCHNGYACRTTRTKKLYIHRELLNFPKDKNVDHINRNRLDNRKENLRLATVSQNGINSDKRKDKTSSIYKGVSWSKHANMWKARINFNKKEFHLGYFKLEDDAAEAYNTAAIRYFGEFAKLNEIKKTS